MSEFLINCDSNKCVCRHRSVIVYTCAFRDGHSRTIGICCGCRRAGGTRQILLSGEAEEGRCLRGRERVSERGILIVGVRVGGERDKGGR